MVRELLFVSVTLGAVAMAAPKVLDSFVDQAGSLEPRDRDTAASRSNTATRSSSTRSAAFQLEVRAAANGHFYLDVGVNGADVRVMVDTGASMVALRESDAASAGLRLHRDDFTLPLSTANGTSYGASTTIDSIVVDHIEVRDVRAVVIPDDQLTISLLGTSFLSRLARFEVSGSILIIEN